MTTIPTVQVRYTGKRPQPFRYTVLVDGKIYNGQGYVFAHGVIHTMSKLEADVLTGVTPPVVDEKTGKVITGFIVHHDLGKDGLVGETFELVH